MTDTAFVPPAVDVQLVTRDGDHVELIAVVEGHTGNHRWAADKIGPRTWSVKTQIPGLGFAVPVFVATTPADAVNGIHGFHTAEPAPHASVTAAVARSGYPGQWHPGKGGCPCPADGRDSQCPEHGLGSGDWATPERMRGGVDDPRYVPAFED